jgi:hypothetical protein
MMTRYQKKGSTKPLNENPLKKWFVSIFKNSIKISRSDDLIDLFNVNILNELVGPTGNLKANFKQRLSHAVGHL